MTLDFFAHLRDNVRRFPERIAIQHLGPGGRETYTYRQVACQAACIARRLAGAGISPGDHAGILIETHPLWGLAFLGAQSAGAVIVPLDPQHDPQTLAALIEHAECRLILVTESLLPRLEAAEAHLAVPPARMVIARSQDEVEEPALPLVARRPDDELMILYTSGTTGTPKGAVLTGRNVYQNVVAGIQMVRPTSDEHFLNVLPLCHVLALVINFIIPLYLGARVTFLPVLEAQRVLQAFREEGITLFVCVPQFYYLLHRRILQQVERQAWWKRVLFYRLLSLSHLANDWLGWNPGRRLFPAIHQPFGPKFRLFGAGGARFDPQVAVSLRDMGFSLVQAFGMTETAALATIALPRGRAVGSAGVPLPHTEIRIDRPDESGTGELLLRGDNVMLGYWKNPEATAEALKDGWLHTGDLGYIDRRGFLHITGRSKELIVLSSGKNVHPEEVERYYQAASRRIKEICVVGVPEEGGERLHAVVVPDFEVLKQEGVVNVYDAIRWEMETVSQKLPGYKRVTSCEIRQDPLPRTTTRKLKRLQVRQEVIDGRRGAAARPQEEAVPCSAGEALAYRLIRRVRDVPVLRPEMNLELDVGLSSLERVELFGALQEATGHRLSEEEAVRIHTVEDLAKAAGLLGGEVCAGEPEARLDWKEILSAPLDAEEERRCREVLHPAPVREGIRYLAALAVRAACRLLFRLRWEGIENLPHAPFLLCPNHESYLDVFVVTCALPWRVSRRLFFLGDVTIFHGRLMGWAARFLKVVTVSQDRAVRSALRLAAEGLRSGQVLCVFPEGERSIDGRLKTFRKGPAIVATELGTPVVPVGIEGAWEVWRRGSNQIRLHPVRVRFGPPLEPAGKSAEAFNQELREAVGRLL